MTRHEATCMCARCLIRAAALAAASRVPDDPARQRQLVEAYCAGRLRLRPAPARAATAPDATR